jgi:F-type H+-transporting ATPase subunit gamma
MAGVSTKEIKNRIRSMESTKQITKAMEMVAASKLRRAQAQIAASRPYFETLRDTIDDIIANNRDFSSPYLVARPVKKVAYVVIAGDRGLAGGYNSNILKLVQSRIQDQDAVVLPIGKKALDYFRSHKVPMLSQRLAIAADMSIGECFSVAKQLSKDFRAGKFDEVHVVYTNFVSILSQTPEVMQLLPLTTQKQAPEGISQDFLYEPGATEVFDAIVPEYLGGILYGALCESRASEQAARRTAMDSATSNAEEMIADLSLKFNRARQAAITQEITEIVAGS